MHQHPLSSDFINQIQARNGRIDVQSHNPRALKVYISPTHSAEDGKGGKIKVMYVTSVL